MRRQVVLEDSHFRRQAPVDRYIVDFCAFAAKLIVEVDGNQHGTDEALVYDALRTARLESLGYRVLRFSNYDVMTNIDSVIDTICANLPAPETPTPGPSPQGGGERQRRATGKRQALAKAESNAPSHPSPSKPALAGLDIDAKSATADFDRGGAGVGAEPLRNSPRTSAATTQEP